jgi:PA14 domain/Glycosyl hydrolase family 3 N terminal domain/Glycosyl hydrolase family 3 C-terminal domain
MKAYPPRKRLPIYAIALTTLLQSTLNIYAQQELSRTETRVNEILSKMTLDEKLDYIGGGYPSSSSIISGVFNIKAIPRLGLPWITMVNGPLGIQTLSGAPSTRYLAGLTLAATWNSQPAFARGKQMGRDARARGYHVDLGPGIDPYRTPLGGRNFEYNTGEDPFLGSKLVIPLVSGFQQQGVWANVKHYAANGTVLLKNHGDILPLERNRISSIAVLGRLAPGIPPTGFGSSFLLAIRFVSELDGIRKQAGSNVRVDFISAGSPDSATAKWELANGGTAGLKGEYFTSNDLSGSPAATRIDTEVDLDWTQPDVIPGEIPTTDQNAFSVRWTGKVDAQYTGDHLFKVRADGGVRLFVNGQLLIDNFLLPTPPPVYGTTLPVFAKIQLEAGQSYDVRLEYRRTTGFASGSGSLLGVQFWINQVPGLLHAWYPGENEWRTSAGRDSLWRHQSFWETTNHHGKANG